MWEDVESGRIDRPACRPATCRACPRPSASPSITCAPACRATPMRRPVVQRSGPPLCLGPCRGMAGQSRAPLRAGHRAFPDAAARRGAGCLRPPRARRPSQHRRVLKIAVPIVLSNATVPILGAVDTGVVGQMGEAAPIGAVGIGAIILSPIYWIFGFLRMGTVGLTSQALGAGDRGEVAALLTRALMIGLAAGVRADRAAGADLCRGLPRGSPARRGRGAWRAPTWRSASGRRPRPSRYGITGWLIAAGAHGRGFGASNSG
jgi:hypothetical protein